MVSHFITIVQRMWPLHIFSHCKLVHAGKYSFCRTLRLPASSGIKTHKYDWTKNIERTVFTGKATLQPHTGFVFWLNFCFLDKKLGNIPIFMGNNINVCVAAKAYHDCMKLTAT